MSITSPHARKIQIYSEHAERYDDGLDLVIGEELFRERRQWATEGVERGHRVLDLGCGTGRLLPLLGEAVGPSGHVIGADLCPAMLEVARRRLGESPGPISLIQLDATWDLPFPSETFDCVCALGLIQEVLAPRTLLEEILRIIRPGGSFRALATTYRELSEAAEIHRAASEELAFHFRPQNTIASMFLQIFGPAAATRWIPLPRLTDPTVWERINVPSMQSVLASVREAGHDPREVEMGILHLTGRRLP
ncbi:class I SAM-dependent methyltransferase [Candidatus Sumerlaeota bacterium]|nr:class I SAM-dependent methyltransferase [Candidatus Sumerlaeota bacterium]